MTSTNTRGFIKRMLRILPLFAAGIVLFAASSVQAASNGLGITPRKDYSVEQGKSISDVLYISNLSLSQNLEVTMRLLDFGAQNETGAPALQLNEDAPAVPWTLKPFIKIPKSVSVPAGKSTNIPISISIPASQGAGSYYSAIE
ncbi:MAG TPA: hypothetical protein VFM05_12040, partial [Candidatus Saccharimonadales bacterium]|nr:hypothetical protein [Candidatus Saccharimonadales bacterium]